MMRTARDRTRLALHQALNDGGTYELDTKHGPLQGQVVRVWRDIDRANRDGRDPMMVELASEQTSRQLEMGSIFGLSAYRPA
jgi:hypothetical protein